MPREELQRQMNEGVAFWGHEVDGEMVAVMGIQPVQDVTLIRHAYVQSAFQKRGIGAILLAHLCGLTDMPVLIGTWAAASLGDPLSTRGMDFGWWVPKRRTACSVVTGVFPNGRSRLR